MSVIVILAITSCTDDATDQELSSNGTFLLSSDKGAFTRAASTEQTFSKGTTYQLYAINADNNDFEHNYLKNPASSGPVTGKESDSHEYIDDITFNKFNGRTLNFYAVTNSTSEEVEIIPNGKSVPTCHIEYKNNLTPLKNVMWAKKENQSYKNSGVIKLLFGHTLSKLNLYVMKNSEYQNTNVILNSISLTDYGSGSLNMQTGKYDLSNTDKRDYSCTVYTGGTQIVTTEAETVKNEKVAVTPTIFPIRKEKENLTTSDIENHSTKVTVTTTIGGKETIKTIKITSIMAEGAGSTTTKEVPFAFESNHEYDMVITITKSSLVVTIVPRLYDWIPEEELKEEDEVNGSMTVGGITWMDRNLGATSGDPLASEQAWENSRGYYYQYGRNIPYYIKTYKDKQGIESIYSYGKDKSNENVRPLPFIPGHMTDKALATNYIPNETWTDGSTYDKNKVAINPTDNDKKFNFYFYYNSSWSWWGDWDTGHSTSIKTWTSTREQPCPKGWRIPTKDEYLLILPGNEECGDISFMLQNNSGYIHKGNTYSKTIENEIDSHDTQYIGVKKGYNNGTVGKTGTVYALKKKGASDAYYLRWHIEQAGTKQIDNPGDGDKYRNVLVISRYRATQTDELTDINVFEKNWNNPVDILKMPLSGYINSTENGAGIIYSGSEVVYWTSSATNYIDENPNKSTYPSYTMRAKFAGDSGSNSIFISDSEFRHNGALIRCVRDTKAN
ncbi:hypothetical protein KGMB02408_11300 [Bacteroides faecalis]|uniref:Fibrobacter succinogenes major paralogous domain-containing protein n=2 Tax=Bacteroides faecalis TaxID=2447885 RepID=A0A401LRJ0_9BACE|nr:hypothetical protein KGMB02408_11300 [Bacteroides faecalis]